MSTYIFQFGGIIPTPENPFDVEPAKPMVNRVKKAFQDNFNCTITPGNHFPKGIDGFNIEITGPENLSADKKKMINEALDDLRDNYAFGDLLFCFVTKENPNKIAKSPI